MRRVNRSSNTELISQAASAIEDLLANGTGAVAAGAWASLPEELRALATKQAPPPHPEPIAWMVGTAFWWTKEEAERDAAATGLAVVPVGPMVDTAEVERLGAACAANILARDEAIAEDRRYMGQANALVAVLREARRCVAECAAPETGGPTQREAKVMLGEIDAAISASAESSAPGKQGAPLEAVRANDIQDLLDRAATAIGQYGDSLLGRGQREDSVDFLDLEREVRDLEQEFRGAFSIPSA